MECANKKENEEVTAEDVVHFLEQNSNFFYNRDDLLLSLHLPHHSGEAISLVERQLSVLRDRNTEMRTRLNGLLDTARENDKLFEKTKKLVLNILEAKTIDEVVSCVNKSLCSEFNCDASSVILFGKSSAHKKSQSRITEISEAQEKISGILKSNKAVCGKLRENELKFLFPDEHLRIASAAVVPLAFGNPIGILAIGSCDANHFRTSMGTLFLNYLAEVLNRNLPALLEKTL